MWERDSVRCVVNFRVASERVAVDIRILQSTLVLVSGLRTLEFATLLSIGRRIKDNLTRPSKISNIFRLLISRTEASSHPSQSQTIYILSSPIYGWPKLIGTCPYPTSAHLLAWLPSSLIGLRFFHPDHVDFSFRCHYPGCCSSTTYSFHFVLLLGGKETHMKTAMLSTYAHCRCYLFTWLRLSLSAPYKRVLTLTLLDSLFHDSKRKASWQRRLGLDLQRLLKWSNLRSSLELLQSLSG